MMRPAGAKGSSSAHQSRSRELRPDGEQHVGLEEQPIERRDHHARRHAQRVGRGHRTLAVDRQADRRAEPFAPARAPQGRRHERHRRGSSAGRAAPASSATARSIAPASGGAERVAGCAARAGVAAGSRKHVDRHLQVHGARRPLAPLEHRPCRVERRAELRRARRSRRSSRVTARVTAAWSGRSWITPQPAAALARG